MIDCGEREIAAGYRDLVIAAESPVIDTSSAAIYQLATAVRNAGYKVALSGEGADEALAGYPWLKVNRFISRPWTVLGLTDQWRRWLFDRAAFHPWEHYQKRYEQMGGYHAMSDLYAAAACPATGSIPGTSRPGSTGARPPMIWS